MGLGKTYFTEMCSGSEAGSYLRLTDFVYHSTSGLRVTKEKRRKAPKSAAHRDESRKQGTSQRKRKIRQLKKYRATSLIRNCPPP